KGKVDQRSMQKLAEDLLDSKSNDCPNLIDAAKRLQKIDTRLQAVTVTQLSHWTEQIGRFSFVDC
ncbi:MAG: hypothetical protein MJK04_20380, partial [Psychrosphaera sp.]|nr:hypothetical protein [Psychrosphaera sp.]